jgi:hypothetical protein
MDPTMEIISSYTRTEALEDGALVDVTTTAREAGFRYPVALTRAAWDHCVALSEAAERACNDEQGRLWDLIWMMRNAIRRPRAAGSPEVTFEVFCITTTPVAAPVALRAHVGPGDDGEPVITVMLPDES